MSDPKPGHIAQWIVEDERIVQEEFQPLENIISGVIKDRIPSFSLEKCAEIAETNVADVYDILTLKKEEYADQGIEPVFEVHVDGEEKHYKKIRSSAKSLLESLKLLDCTDFEHFCACLLKRIGSDARTVGRTGDQEIDFWAKNVPIGHIKERAEASSINLFVFGQAKRYSKGKLVAEKDVRSFIGGAIKKGSDYMRECSKAGILSPIIYAFWTTSDFEPSARKYCADIGIRYLNGLALSQLATRAGFAPTNVQYYINEYKNQPVTA